MRLYDTATRALKELPAPPGPVRMYVCGPTVYQRIHVGNARPFVISLWLKRWLERSGYEVTLVENITDVNDKIYAAAPGASAKLAADASDWYVEDTSALGLGRPDHEPKATESIPEIVAMIEAARRDRARLPRRRRRLLPRRQLPRLREALRAPRRRGGDAQPLRGGRGGAAQGGPARLRALEGAQGGRGHVVGLALGPRPAGLAHRVLGDGRGAPRAGLRDPRRRARPRLPTPRERGGAVALARARLRAALDAQRDAAALRREDVEVARQHRLAARGAGRARARDAARLLPRRPLAQAARLLGRGAAAGGGAG